MRNSNYSLILILSVLFIVGSCDYGVNLCRFHNNDKRTLHIIADYGHPTVNNGLSYDPFDIESLDAKEQRLLFSLINTSWSRKTSGEVRIHVYDHFGSSFQWYDLRGNKQRIDSINTYANCLVCYILKHDQLDDCRDLCYPPTEDMRDIEMIPPFDEVIENAKKHH